MAKASGRYKACSDWLKARSEQGILWENLMLFVEIESTLNLLNLKKSGLVILIAG